MAPPADQVFVLGRPSFPASLGPQIFGRQGRTTERQTKRKLRLSPACGEATVSECRPEGLLSAEALHVAAFVTEMCD